MVDRDDSEPPNVERRKPTRGLTWRFGLRKKSSAPSDQDSTESRDSTEDRDSTENSNGIQSRDGVEDQASSEDQDSTENFESEGGQSGVLSRSRLAVVAAEMLELAAKTQEAVACTIVEVRTLKTVNRAERREAGGDDPETVAGALVRVFRRSDVLARWGANSFAVLAIGPGPDSDDVERRMAQRLIRSGDGETGEPDCSISAGRVVHMPWQDEDLDQIVERAEDEMSRRCRLRRARERDFEES